MADNVKTDEVTAVTKILEHLKKIKPEPNDLFVNTSISYDDCSCYYC